MLHANQTLALVVMGLLFALVVMGLCKTVTVCLSDVSLDLRFAFCLQYHSNVSLPPSCKIKVLKSRYNQ